MIKQIMRSIFLVMFSVQHSFGYFYYLCVVKKINPMDNSCQYIVLLADYHDKNHNVNKEQRVYFESLLKKYRTKNIKLIVEDLSSVNNDGRMICDKYTINCAQGVLGHLANQARSWGIMVDNVEYRYCRVASIGPLINNINTNPYSFKSSSSISIDSLYKEISNEIEKIKKYNDGEKLNAFYKNVLIKVYNKVSYLCFGDKNRDKTVARYCTHLKRKKYRQELENLCIFDSGLIDSNILHSIACCKAPLIFVLAGGSHIEQVSTLLKEIGYQELFTTAKNDTFNPIDLSILDTYMNIWTF